MNLSRSSSNGLSSATICRGLALSAILVGFALLVPTVSFAQAIDIPAMVNMDSKGPATFAVFQTSHTFKADVEDPGTEISRSNASFGVGHRIKLSEKVNLFTLGTYTLQGYDFSGNNNTVKIGSNNNFYQWDDVHRLVVAGIAGYTVNDQWELVGGLIYRSWGEGGADYGDSITGGGIGGVTWHANENLSIGFLVGVFSNIEDSASIMPVPTVDWKFAEDWRVRLGLVSMVDPGVGFELSWQTTDTVKLSTGVTFQNRRFRLRDRERVGKNNNGKDRTDDGGVGQEQSVPIFAMVRWQPTKKMAFDCMGGISVGGSVRLENDDGDYIAEDSYDPAPFVGLKGQFFF